MCYRPVRPASVILRRITSGSLRRCSCFAIVRGSIRAEERTPASLPFLQQVASVFAASFEAFDFLVHTVGFPASDAFQERRVTTHDAIPVSFKVGRNACREKHQDHDLQQFA